MEVVDNIGDSMDGQRIIGSKYEDTKNTPITEVAKMIRQDLRSAFPDIKFSVVCEKYSRGASVHIAAKETGIDRYSPQGLELTSKISEIGEAYNYTERDSFSDYYANKFFVSARIAS